MAKVRVSTLAKEFGMTSKELMGHLADMKIPAKSASSTLEDAYVAMVRKQLASVIEARAQEVEAAKQAEEQAAAAEEAARAAEAERERIAAEKAREEERRQFAAAQAAEEAARAEAEAKKKAEQERLAREKEEAAREAQRRAIPASDSGSRFRSLLDQIAAQETVLKEKKDAEDKAKAERAAELLQLEQLAAELQARSEEMQAQLLRTPRIVGPRRMLRAYPKLRHGSKLRSLPTLREMLHRAEQENKDDNKNTK